MTINQDEFFQNLDADNITPEQAAQMIEFGLEGDTGTPETESETPAAPTDAGDDVSDQGAGESEVNNEADSDEGAGDEADADSKAESEGADPVLMAKDGVHTIPYEKLVEAREGEQHWKAEAEAAKAELERLQAQANNSADDDLSTHEQNAAIAQDAIDEGVDPDLFGDFSEEDLAKGVMKLVDMKLAEIQQQQARQQSQATASNAHYQAIYDAHPDADSVVESKELAEWIDSQPSHIKLGIQTVMEKGSAQDVIGVFDSFKQATGKTQDAADSVREKAKQAA
ncbi:hypothetical protein, partial [Stutzerimonas frequens]|uniref:hypothetical protein n=1 Tax=Stutzerimonas frequens TaxID=2968969 RepID=UPI0022DDC447